MGLTPVGGSEKFDYFDLRTFLHYLHFIQVTNPFIILKNMFKLAAGIRQLYSPVPSLLVLLIFLNIIIVVLVTEQQLVLLDGFRVV